MKDLPTAEEFLNEHPTISHFYDDITEQMVVPYHQLEQAMVDFAKFHVEKALEEVSKKIMIDKKPPIGYRNQTEEETKPMFEVDLGSEYYIPVIFTINKESILNAYPLTLIK